jgi:protein-disulfide isomerase
MRTLRLASYASCAVLCAALAACQPGQKELAEINKKQDEILQRLTALEEGQKRLATPPRAAAQPSEDYNKVYLIDPGASPVRGPKHAKVTIVEFSDFQCPYCAAAKPVIDQVLAKYPKQVNLVYKQFPLPMHQMARPAAVAALAAQEQGKFWQLHDVLFANHQSLDPAKFELYAKQAGLDVTRFKRDMEQKRAQYEARIQEESQLGQRVDVHGTPTLYIGGKKVPARSVEGMSAMIEEQLKLGGS